MIIKTFDNGWGIQYPLKVYEQSLVERMLKNTAKDDSKTVIINSVWYSQDYHHSVMAWLENNEFDHIVLVAMIDAAIPYPDRYAEFSKPVTAIGYYPGVYNLDFCALFVDKFLKPPDLETLLDYSRIEVPFMCLNRKPHWHRKRLYRKIENLGLIDRGLVSFGDESGTAVRALMIDRDHDLLAPNATVDHYGIPNDIVSLGHIDNWKRCFLNIVTETFYDINKTNFVSEKIYKPIVGCRPFLVYDPDGGTRWLEDRGFQTYVDDFGDIANLDLRDPENLPEFLKILCDQDTGYFRKKFIDLREKIVYNKMHFKKHIDLQNQIIEKGITCPT